MARIGGRLALATLFMVLAGCAASGPAGPPGPQAPRPDPRITATGRGWTVKALAERYLAIAIPANRRLDEANDGFTDHQRDNLAAARADLAAEAATERWFDQRLARIPFPPAIEAMVRALIQANQRRITLTRQEASSASPTELRSFARAHEAADAAVEAEVRRIRRALHLPPPAGS